MRFSLTSKDDEDITVKAPAKSVISPEKKIEKATKKSLEKERFGVLQFPKKISKYLGITAAITGGLILTLFAFMSITGQKRKQVIHRMLEEKMRNYWHRKFL